MFAILRYADYKDLVPKGKHIEIVASPYMMGCQSCFRAVLESISAPERVKFVFEKQLRYSPYRSLPQWFFSMLYPDRLEIEYLPKDSTCLFQAADYLAFALRYMKIDPQSKKFQLTKSIVLSGNEEKPGFIRGYHDNISKDKFRDPIRNSAAAYEQAMKAQKGN